MIVDPDFLDHWRTGMVADALGDPMAPLYILRLWGHCQERKSDTFIMPTRGLKAQCKFGGDAEAFESALIEAGFIARDGDTITVIGWAEKNASLLAAWENGSRGGRPKRNPAETHGKPTGNPAVTQREPIANPDETDKSREDKNSPNGECAGAQPAPKQKRKTPETPLPEDFGISERVRAWAASKGHGQLQEHLESFIGKARAKDYRYANWDDAFMNAIRDDWAKLKGRPTLVQPATSAAPSDAATREMLDRQSAVIPDSELARKARESVQQRRLTA